MRPTAAALAALALVLAPVAAPAQSGKAGDFVAVQPAGQWLASRFIGQPVSNAAGETIGNINDVLFDKGGRAASVVIGAKIGSSRGSNTARRTPTARHSHQTATLPWKRSHGI